MIHALLFALVYSTTDTCEIFEGRDIVKGTMINCCAPPHFKGPWYGPPVQSDEECQALCTAHPECNAWVTTTPEIKKRKCYMTSGDVEWETDSKRNGGLPCRDTDTCPIFEGADIVTFESCCGRHGARVESDEECQARCTAHPLCKAWVTNSPEIKRARCYMTSGDVEWEDDSSRHGGLPCVDCAGVRGGSAVEDACGVCDGDGSSCADLGCGPGNPAPSGCDNQCGSTMEDLGCGCGQPGPTGCDNQCGSTMEDLGCGCGEPGPSVYFGCERESSCPSGCADAIAWPANRDSLCGYNILPSPCTTLDNDSCSMEVAIACASSGEGDGSTDGDEEDVVSENKRLKKANSALLEALKSLNAN